MAKKESNDNPLHKLTDKLMQEVDKNDSTPRDQQCYAYMREVNAGNAEFHGNPWHAFLRVMSEYLEGIPKPDRKAGLPIHDGKNHYRLSWEDITNISLARRDITHTEVTALAQWIGLSSNAEEFIKSGEHFIAEREELKIFRAMEPKAPRPERSAPAHPPVEKTPHPKIYRPPVEKLKRSRPDPVAPKPAIAPRQQPLSLIEQHAPLPSPAKLILKFTQACGITVEELATKIEMKLPAGKQGSVLPQLRGTVGSLDEQVLIEALNILNLEQHDAHSLLDASMAARTSPVSRA